MGAGLTRKQYFKEHVYRLHKQDPERWTDHVLSRHFLVPLENMRAMLALQTLAEVEVARKGGVDPELKEIASDFEEYLDDVAPPPDASDQFLARANVLKASAKETIPPPAFSLSEMSPIQETRLLSSIVRRFGGGEVADGVPPNPKALRIHMEGLLGGLSSEELSALLEQVNGRSGESEGRGSGEKPEDAGEADHAKLLQALLKSVAPEMPAAVKAGLSSKSFDLTRLDDQLPDFPTFDSAVDDLSAAGADASAGKSKMPSSVVRCPAPRSTKEYT